MTKVEDILNQAENLSSAERIQLAGLLLDKVGVESNGEEQDVGHRGLASWTASARGDDWAEFYPAGMRVNGSTSQ